MEIGRTARAASKHVKVDSGIGAGKVPLSMYLDPPTEELTLTQFESYALDRLAVLKHIETSLAKGLKGAELSQSVAAVCKKFDLDDHYKDNTSHFIVRLAYCNSEELRRWMTTQESWLFRIRFESQTADAVRRFFTEYKLSYKPLQDIPASILSGLQAVHQAHSRGHEPMDRDFFKVPFEDAVDLVGKRRVFVHAGWAYIPRKDLVTILFAKFRMHLSKELAATYRASQNMIQDSRIKKLVGSLSKRHVGVKYKATFSGEVSPDQIPALAEQSFPLCMSNMHEMLMKEAHLRYQGRRTYGLFLKGIGLSMQDALTFWRQAFSRKVPADKFNKEYAYNIRHNYGKEGKRADYTPYSCVKIIMEQPGINEHHGCPFRSFNEPRLRAKLMQKSVPTAAVDEIMSLVKNQHYQIACQRYFKAMHPGASGDNVGNHPNQYFDESVKFYKEEKESGGAEAGAAADKDASKASAPAKGAASSSAAASASASGVAPMVDVEPPTGTALTGTTPSKAATPPSTTGGQVKPTTTGAPAEASATAGKTPVAAGAGAGAGVTPAQ